MCCGLTGSRCLQRCGRKQKKSAAETFSVPPTPLTPGDMKPIILMGSGSIHLNTGLHMMTMMILRATCHQRKASWRQVWSKSHERNLKKKKKHLQKGSACISIWLNPTVNYLSNQICLCVCLSITASIFHPPRVPILSFP